MCPAPFVSSAFVVDPGHEFDDIPDEQPTGPLLPPEDRLWRHPSELAMQRVDSPEVVAARNRWLASTPTRAGAWSAGLVGAVLATGVVLVGTHLTSWIGPRSGESAPTATLTTVIRPAPRAAMATYMPSGAAQTVAYGMALVEAVSRTTSRSGDGLVIRSDGMIIVPESIVQGATDVQVLTADPGGGFDQQFDASVVGVDSATGLALLHVGVNGLATARFAPSGVAAAGQWTFFEWASPLRTVLSFAAVSQTTPGARLKNGPGVLVSVTANVAGLPADPVGAIMVDGRLQVAGIVAERNGLQFVEVPPSVLERVGAELIAYHQVRHGWLGITGVASSSTIRVGRSSVGGGDPGGPGNTMTRVLTGVKVVSVLPGSSAARVGIQPGDLIVDVDGQRVTTMADIQSLLYLAEPHQPVSVTVERGNASWVCTPRLSAAA